MKMSDVFDLPLQKAVNELAVIDRSDAVVGWADAFTGELARDSIVEAVNNHDRLVEFVAMVAKSDTRTHAHKHVAQLILKELGHEI